MAVKIKGLDKLTRDLRRLGKEGERAVASEIGISAKNIEKKAKGRLPFEYNFIGQKINTEFENKGLTAKVGVEGTKTNPIPAYVEFGTGIFAKELLFSGEYNEDVRKIAIQFKKERDGTLPATPYLFPSFFEERPKLIQELKNRLEALSKTI